MARPYGAAFAKVYDFLYFDKDYSGEAGYIVRLFRKFSRRHVSRIIDISAGTGGHAIELAKRGFDVFGIDVSGSMIALARKKATSLGVDARFKVANMESFDASGRFDGAISMFDSICYLRGRKNVAKTLARLKRVMLPGAVLILQYWNGDAVMSQGPSDSHKVFQNAEMSVTRFGTPRLVPKDQYCYMDYRLVVKKRGRAPLEFKEVHRVRFFFPEEMKSLLSETGFQPLGIFRFKSLMPATPDDWSVCCVSRS
jgi:SAM-dependent methyltransferase